jgi:hypothetical protein
LLGSGTCRALGFNCLGSTLLWTRQRGFVFIGKELYNGIAEQDYVLYSIKT